MGDEWFDVDLAFGQQTEGFGVLRCVSCHVMVERDREGVSARWLDRA